MRTQSRLLPIELTQFKAMGNRTTAYLFAFEFSRDIVTVLKSAVL